MSIKMKFRKRNVFIELGKMTPRIEKGIKEALEKIGPSLVRTGENQGLNENKFGKTYKIKGEDHVASAPGQSPAIASPNNPNNYNSSFDYDAVGSTELIFGNSADYATFLERGTNIMEPRPGLRNAVNFEARNMQTYMDSSLKEALDLES